MEIKNLFGSDLSFHNKMILEQKSKNRKQSDRISISDIFVKGEKSNKNNYIQMRNF